jgi:hypothetical protein
MCGPRVWIGWEMKEPHSQIVLASRRHAFRRASLFTGRYPHSTGFITTQAPGQIPGSSFIAMRAITPSTSLKCTRYPLTRRAVATKHRQVYADGVAGRIGHVHVADSNRRALGMGHLDWRESFQTLSYTGYDGVYSIEAFQGIQPADAARIGIEFLTESLRKARGK